MTTGKTTIAEQLFHAYQSKQPIDFISKTYQLDEREAYATQDLLVEKIQDAEQTEIGGYKVSMTSAATQSIANTHEPAYGTIVSNKIIQSGAEISLSDLFSPLIEPEIMFILTDDLPENPSYEDILKRVNIAPGIEVPDARYRDWFPNFTLADLLADNTASGLIVIGDAIAPLDEEGFKNIDMALTLNQADIGKGHSTAVLGNPLESVKWLAQKLATHDKQLKKGQVISSGTFISPIPVEKGTYEAVYSNVGNVSVTFK